jgi:hypothetical protein
MIFATIDSERSAGSKRSAPLLLNLANNGSNSGACRVVPGSIFDLIQFRCRTN